MWITNIFKKKTDKVQSQKQLLKDDMQEEPQLKQSRIYTVSQQEVDKRYSTLRIIHNKTLNLPNNAIHFIESIFFEDKDVMEGKMKENESFSRIQLIVTDRQMVIIPDISAKNKSKTVRGNNILHIYFGMFEKIELIENKKEMAKLKITLKDDRVLFVQSILYDRLRQIQKLVKQFGFPNGINKFYAFKYGKVTPSINGWKVYDFQKQFLRQKAGLFCFDSKRQSVIQPHHAYQIINNQSFELSYTYPSKFIVPASLTSQEIVKCSKFRTKERLPVMTYLFEYKPSCYCSLFRCSQTKGGILGNRCQQDQRMIRHIDIACRIISVETIECGSRVNCKIFDARGLYAAWGNKISGKGFETPQNYNCEFQFLNIPNIHAVRQCYNKIRNCNPTNMMQVLGQSGWIDYLQLILSGAKSMASSMVKGTNIIVHCSDGWDRTTQLACLTQILIDPYYRTIQGLAVLIEKDWRHFGHKFRVRSGQYNHKDYNEHQKSPIFIQFLDCILQIMRQFPLSFQYNIQLLNFLVEAYQSYTYGTFLTNNIAEARQIKLQKQTVSVWSDVFFNRQNYLNKLYTADGPRVLEISVQGRDFVIWKQLIAQEWSNQEQHLTILKRQMEINKNIKESVRNLDEQIQKLRKELYDLQEQK